MPGTLGRDEFVAMLEERFPEIADDIDDCIRGLIDPEMALVMRATQRAISKEDKAAVREYFRFIDDVYRRAAPEVRNAVCVSYLEHLSFDGRHGARIGARKMLSPALQTALRDIEADNESLIGKRNFT